MCGVMSQMEEFRRYGSEFKNGDETVQHKIAFSVFTTISSEPTKMKERSSIGIRSGLLERFSERLSSDCASTLSGVLSSVIGVMVTSVSEGRPRLRSDLIPSLLVLSSHSDSSLSTPATHSLGSDLFSLLHHFCLSSLFLSPTDLFDFALICVWSLLCGGSLSCVEVEGVLSSGIVERLCTRIESEDENESGSVDVVATLAVLDGLCCGLSEVIEREKSKSTDKARSNESDLFSLTRRCGFALARIEKAVVTLGQVLNKEGQNKRDVKTQQLQKELGGIVFRHFFSSSIQSSSKKEIGAIGIDLAAVRRDLDEKMKHIEADREKEKETARNAEEERQREFARKMREMDEMKRMNEELISEGRQRREEKKREEERKRKEERRRNMKEGAAAIEVFARDKFTLSGNVFTKSVSDWSSLFSLSFGPVVVRITFVIRNTGHSYFHVGLIATDMVEQATQLTGYYFSRLERAAGWDLHPTCLYARQNYKEAHKGSPCKVVAVGQRVVLEADGRGGKRTLKLSQDGETQPAFFSNIPVPFRFGIQILLSFGLSLKFQPAFDDSPETKVLNQVIIEGSMRMLDLVFLLCSTVNCRILVKANLVPQLIPTLNPQSLSLRDCEHIHTCLIRIIASSFWLTTPDGLTQLEIEDGDEEQAVHETVLKQVVVPSAQYICHLCVNRFSIVDLDQSQFFVSLLTKLIQI
ncbi:hypothetical protein BLNAU_12094 [Blattamonas nauphoetae]|uniref:Uncharacterized protein n=1 Tax=Blattamonas nauphoetae TaxID=2049346 RepID=A0ABQ9XKG6_9EUKA|nr:hypothetical protein BLNAU_12094 [Blattamonas nauphoetae]